MSLELLRLQRSGSRVSIWTLLLSEYQYWTAFTGQRGKLVADKHNDEE